MRKILYKIPQPIRYGFAELSIYFARDWGKVGPEDEDRQIESIEIRQFGSESVSISLDALPELIETLTEVCNTYRPSSASVFCNYPSLF